MKTLILYSTVDGHTHKICQFIANALGKIDNQNIELMALCDFSESIATKSTIHNTNETASKKFTDIDTIIIGASIRYGKHRPYVYQFIEKYKADFTAHNVNTAFFTVNLVARKPEKNTVETNPYISKFLETTNWQPDLVEVFAGQLDYSIYGLFDKMMIKLIMKMTNGATSSDKPIVYTNWQKVGFFVDKVAKL